MSLFTCAFVTALSISTVDQSVLLDEYAPCGQISLYVVCRLQSIDTDFNRIEALTGPADSQGCHSFSDLSRAAEELGLHPLGVHVDRNRLLTLPTPSIIHSQYATGDTRPHLSVLLGTCADGAYVLDAPYSVQLIPWPQFELFWTGNVLLFPLSVEKASMLRAEFSRSGDYRLWLFASAVASGTAAVGLLFFLIRLRLRANRRFSIKRPIAALMNRLRAISTVRIPLLRGTLRYITVCVVILSAVALLAIGTRTLPEALDWFSGSPRLVLDAPLIELGEFAPGEHEAKVLVRNGGRKPLAISKIEPSCSCAVVSKPGVVAPFSEEILKVTIYVASGRGYANLTVKSNDPKASHDVMLRWFGSAQPVLVPRSLEVGESPVGTRCERMVSVSYPGGLTAVVPTLERNESPAGNIHVTVVENDPIAFRTDSASSHRTAAGRMLLRVLVDSPDQPGIVKTVSDLTCRYGEQAYKLKLPISVRFVNAIQAEPDIAVFTRARRSQLKDQRRSVRVVGRADVKDLAVTRHPDWLRCELLPWDDQSCELRMTVVESPATAFATEQVELSLAADPNVRIPVSVRTFFKEFAEPSQN